MAEWFLFLPQLRLGIDAVVARAVAAESAGFDGIAFIDHLEPPAAVDQPIWEAMTLATRIVAAMPAEHAGRWRATLQHMPALRGHRPAQGIGHQPAGEGRARCRQPGPCRGRSRSGPGSGRPGVAPGAGHRP